MGKPTARHEGFSRPGDPPAPGLKPRHVWEGSWPLQWIAPPQEQKETWVASCACLGSGPPLLFPSGKWAPCEAVSLVPENIPVAKWLFTHLFILSLNTEQLFREYLPHALCHLGPASPVSSLNLCPGW